MSIAWLLTNIVVCFLLPPANGLLLVVAGMLLRRRFPRLARTLLVTGFLLIFLLSLRGVSRQLLAPLESRYPPLAIQQLSALQIDAIVVLGGGRYREAPEFGMGDEGNATSLVRMRYAALLARATRKPLLVTGGRPDGGNSSEAESMQRTLARDFGVRVQWLEDASDNTLENAHYSAQILLPKGIRRIALVTHAWHMPRSVQVFEAAGFSVLPAPTAFVGASPLTPRDYLPRAESLAESSLAMHEWIGLLWYRLRS